MLDKWIYFTLLGGVASSLVSITLSDVFFTISIVFWVANCCKERKICLKMAPFFWFILIFFAAVLTAVLCSSDFSGSAPYLKKFAKFFYIPLLFTYLPRERIEEAIKVIFVVLGASAGYAFLQYFWLMEVSLLNRIVGFMGHWMTFSGQLMIGSVALTAYLIFYRFPQFKTFNASLELGASGKSRSYFGWSESRKRFISWVVFLVALLFVLTLTQTRSAWCGTIGSLFLLLWVYRVRWLMTALGVLVILLVFLPSSFKQRLHSGFDLADTTTSIRLELLKTGGNIIKSHPWLGLGPGMVPRLYREYAQADRFPSSIYQHLHNNIFHIAAEMGLITLAAWLAIWICLFRDFIRFTFVNVSSNWPYCVSMMGVSVMTAFLLAGLFEYNFGDSEILILVLFFITLPYVANSKPTEAA